MHPTVAPTGQFMARFLTVPFVLLTAAIVFAQPHAEKEHVAFLPDDIKWVDGPASLPPGAKMAILEGDPTKEGPFVLRVKMPDGFKIMPHTHPKNERVTVLSGTLCMGMGEKYDEKVSQAMPAVLRTNSGESEAFRVRKGRDHHPATWVRAMGSQLPQSG